MTDVTREGDTIDKLRPGVTLTPDQAAALVTWAREQERPRGCSGWGPTFDGAMRVAQEVGAAARPTSAIEIVPSPRPEDDSPEANPLPGYHDLLNALCMRFGIPGSPSFNQAMDWMAEHYERRTP